MLEYKGLKLEIAEQVYLPSDDTYLLLDNLIVKPRDVLLEIGTGSGIIACVAANVAEKIVATDISPLAIECAKKNMRFNKLENKIEFRIGYLFEPIHLDERFDIIVFNAPYLPDPNDGFINRSDWLEKAWSGGETGRNVIDPFILGCKSFLKSRGKVQLIQSNLSDISKSCSLFQSQGFKAEIAATRSMFFEKIVLINAILTK